MQFVNIHTHKPTGRHIELPGAGVHPWRAGEGLTPEVLEEMTRAAIIGEIGLDFACSVPRHVQVELFKEQLQIALRLNKPVVLHCVKAFEPLMEILREYDLRAVIFHGFIGSPQQARQALDRGYWLSFGPRTFRSPKTIAALQATPLQQLFLETDDAEVTIEEVYQRAAALKGITVDELQAATLENCKYIFYDDER